MITGESAITPEDALEFRLNYDDYCNRFIAYVSEHLRFYYCGQPVSIPVPREVMNQDEFKSGVIESRHLFVAQFRLSFGNKGWQVAVRTNGEEMVLVFSKK